MGSGHELKNDYVVWSTLASILMSGLRHEMILPSFDFGHDLTMPFEDFKFEDLPCDRSESRTCVDIYLEDAPGIVGDVSDSRILDPEAYPVWKVPLDGSADGTDLYLGERPGVAKHRLVIDTGAAANFSGDLCLDRYEEEMQSVFESFGVSVNRTENPARFNGIDDTAGGVTVSGERHVPIFIAPGLDVVTYRAHVREKSKIPALLSGPSLRNAGMWIVGQRDVMLLPSKEFPHEVFYKFPLDFDGGHWGLPMDNWQGNAPSRVRIIWQELPENDDWVTGVCQTCGMT